MLKRYFLALVLLVTSPGPQVRADDQAAHAATVTGISIGCRQAGFSVPVETVRREIGEPVVFPWGCIDRLDIILSKPTYVDPEDVDVKSTDGRIAGLSISTSAANDSLSVNLPDPLKTGSYVLILRDSAGRTNRHRLDGESTGYTPTSGNGIPGGNFHFYFEIQIGDANGDGNTDVEDYAIASRNGNPDIPSPSLDINGDGNSDQIDLEIIRTHFGEKRASLRIAESITARLLFDTIGVSDNEIAVLRSGSAPTLYHYQLDSEYFLGQIELPDLYRYVDIEPVLDSRGNPALAVLGVHTTSGEVIIWLWQYEGNTLHQLTSMGNDQIALDMEFHAGRDGGTLLVLSKEGGSGHRVTKLIDLSGNGTGTYEHDSLAPPSEILASRNSPTWIASGETEDDRFFLAIHDESNDMFGGSAFNSTGTLIDVVFLEQTRASPVNYALLYQPEAQQNLGVIEIRSSEGETLSQIDFIEQGELIAMGYLPNAESIAVLTENSTSKTGVVRVFDIATGSEEEPVALGAGANSTDMLIVSRGNEDALIVPQINKSFGITQIKSRYYQSARRLVTIPVENAKRAANTWFEDNRVHGHTRLAIAKWDGTDQSSNAAAYFADLGARVFSRHAKSADEAPWWTTEFGSETENFSDEVIGDTGLRRKTPGRNYIQPYISEAWEQSLPLIAYYFDASDKAMAARYPKWICKSHGGRDLSHRKKGKFLDITGPYGEVVKNRMLELADMGASGIYLDFRHMPPEGCWGTELEDNFEEIYGLIAPELGDTYEYQLFMEFYASRISAAIAGWKAAVAREYPQLELVISVTTVPALTRLEMNTELVAVDNPKSEFTLATRRGLTNSVFHDNPEIHEPKDAIRMALGYTLLRDLASNGTPHIWNAFTPNRRHLLAFLSAVITYGGIASLDVLEQLLKPGDLVDGFTNRFGMASGFELGNAVSPHFQNVSPVRWGAVLFAESRRNDYGLDSKSAWEELLSPTVGGFESLHHAGLPAAVISEEQVRNGKLDEFALLYLPAPLDTFAADIQSAVDTFTSGGGILVTAARNWQWKSESEYLSSVETLTEMVSTHSATAETVVGNKPEKVHVVTYRRDPQSSKRGMVLVAATNDFTFSQSSIYTSPIAPESINQGPDPVEPGITVDIAPTLLNFQPGRSALFAYNVLTDTEVPVTWENNKIRLNLPGFQYMGLVAITSLEN